MPQGSILGPLQLLVYINDIILNVKSSIYIFTDNTSLTQKVDRTNPHEAFAILSSDLEVLMSWANRWHMTFNPLKTDYVIFSNRHLPQYPTLTMDNQLLHRVTDHKHLGLFIDEKFKWGEHISYITNVCNKLIGTICTLGTDCPRFCLLNYYTAYIRPRLEYAIICYASISDEKSSQIEKIQRRAIIT